VEHSPVSETGTETGTPPAQDAIVPTEDTQQESTVNTGTPIETSSQDTSHGSQEEKSNEEVRPFTDFIEEFRQAEARFSASLQDYQANALPSPTSPVVEEEAIHSEESYQPVLDTSVISSMDEAVASFAALPGSQVHETETTNGDVPVEPTGAVAPHTSASETTATGEEAKTPASNEGEEANSPVVPPITRPVSPLLRPATPRGRVPRHGIRHHEERPAEKVIPSETQQTAQTAQTPQEAGQVEPTVSEPPTVVEQPKPARRYRFDRPAASTPSITPPVQTPVTPPLAPVQARVDESKDSAGRGTTPVRSDNGQTPDDYGQPGEKEIATQQSIEATASKQSVTQEPPVVESTTTSASPTSPATPEDRRRRHGQDRQRGKEQPTPPPVPTPAPVAEIVPPVPLSVTPAIQSNPVVAQGQGDEVAPEDLPPLEYSELQKASSRRRRRRHGSVVAGAASTPLVPTPKVVTVTPEQPVSLATTTPTPPPVTPAVPPRPTATPVVPNAVPPVAPATPYSITSGFTVSQMNQNHEGKNPFMGPDPSPARGTTAAQNVRSIRTDAQRTPAYPVRPTEATSASVHQLANIVSQAIQTQTDRMVTELRRANQGPTNISVSMPPFPSNERVGVFVDVANLLYSARTMRMTVDFGKLLDFLRGNRRLIRAHAYCPTSPQPGDEQMFLQAVKGLGYRITTKNYKTFSSGAKKADLDLDLCMDVVRLVDGKAVDCVVLVSGDSDFMPMLDYCSDHGVRVEVAAFDEAMSGTLRQSCDLFINLSMLEEIRA
jgi:uncharacterized LabA/DUF88 family protein